MTDQTYPLPKDAEELIEKAAVRDRHLGMIATAMIIREGRKFLNSEPGLDLMIVNGSCWVLRALADGPRDPSTLDNTAWHERDMSQYAQLGNNLTMPVTFAPEFRYFMRKVGDAFPTTGRHLRIKAGMETVQSPDTDHMLQWDEAPTWTPLRKLDGNRTLRNCFVVATQTEFGGLHCITTDNGTRAVLYPSEVDALVEDMFHPDEDMVIPAVEYRHGPDSLPLGDRGVIPEGT